MKDKIDLSLEEDALYEEAGDEPDSITRAKLDAIGFLRGETDCITDEEIEPPKTDEDIDRLIAILRKERGEIAEYSLFGDPNWQMIDAQIEICEWAKGGK